MSTVIKITQRELATILPALEYWKEELAEGKDWIPESNYFRRYSPLTESEIDALSERFKSLGRLSTSIECLLNEMEGP